MLEWASKFREQQLETRGAWRSSLLLSISLQRDHISWQVPRYSPGMAVAWKIGLLAPLSRYRVQLRWLFTNLATGAPHSTFALATRLPAPRKVLIHSLRVIGGFIDLYHLPSQLPLTTSTSLFIDLNAHTTPYRLYKWPQWLGDAEDVVRRRRRPVRQSTSPGLVGSKNRAC